VLQRFAYASSTPFARGQHRGIEIGGSTGELVRAACPGRVSFAGRVPGYGAGVSVTCGTLTATYLRLVSLSVRRGDRVAAGVGLGRLGRGGLHLGARRTGRRWAYVDPLALLGDDPPTRPVAPLPRGPWRVGPRRSGPSPLPAAVPVPVPAPGAAPAGAVPRPAVGLVAWLGLGLLAAGVPAIGLGHVRRRRRAAARGRCAPADAA
jgi:murein DD-endopeptidase MepM/ murein hydrolase activator NlpD